MAERATNVEIGRTGGDWAPADTAVDARAAAMRRLVDQLADQSAAAALSALRDAFPDAPLAERVQAMRYSRH